MTSTLETIAADRRERIAREYGTLSAADRERLACCSRAPRDFVQALHQRLDIAVIAEIQKCSPVTGPIAPECEASKQALHCQDGGAAAIAVVTEPMHFGGSYADLSDVADAVDVPVLCADFVVDPIQLFVARGHGADAVLLMAGLLGDEASAYADLGRTLGLAPIVEISDAGELHVALRSGAEAVIVSAREGALLGADTALQHELVAEASRYDVTVIAGSGVRWRRDVVAAGAAGTDAVMVGEPLMRTQFPEDVLSELTGVRKGVRQ